MLRNPDSGLHGVWLVDEPYEEEVGGGTNGTGNNEADEDDAHKANGETICTDVHDWEGFKERVL